MVIHVLLELYLIVSSIFQLSEDGFSTEDVDWEREHIKRLICEITKNRAQKISPADLVIIVFKLLRSGKY